MDDKNQQLAALKAQVDHLSKQNKDLESAQARLRVSAVPSSSRPGNVSRGSIGGPLATVPSGGHLLPRASANAYPSSYGPHSHVSYGETGSVSSPLLDACSSKLLTEFRLSVVRSAVEVLRELSCAEAGDRQVRLHGCKEEYGPVVLSCVCVQ